MGVAAAAARRPRRPTRPSRPVLGPVHAAAKSPPVPYSGEQSARNEISEIVKDRLYLSNWRGAEDVEALQARGVTHIVCINDQEEPFPEHFTYLVVRSVEDHDDERIAPTFARVRRFVDGALGGGGAVLVHCAGGISRSSAVMIAMLMELYAMPLREAFEAVYSRRPVTWPNVGFMAQLIEHELALQRRGALPHLGPGGAKPGTSLAMEEYAEWTNKGVEEVVRQIDVMAVERTLSTGGGGARRGGIDELSALSGPAAEAEGSGTHATRLASASRLTSVSRFTSASRHTSLMPSESDASANTTLTIARAFSSHARASSLSHRQSEELHAELSSTIREQRQARVDEQMRAMRKMRQEQASMYNLFKDAAAKAAADQAEMAAADAAAAESAAAAARKKRLSNAGGDSAATLRRSGTNRRAVEKSGRSNWRSATLVSTATKLPFRSPRVSTASALSTSWRSEKSAPNDGDTGGGGGPSLARDESLGSGLGLGGDVTRVSSEGLAGPADDADVSQ